MAHWIERQGNWIERQIHSHTVQLVGAALVGGLVMGGAIWGGEALRRRLAVEDLKDSIPAWDEKLSVQKLTEYGTPSGLDLNTKEEERTASLAARARKGDYDEDLILEQLARNRVFLNPDGLSNLRSSFIIVIGLGGVGSHATASLARSGVSKIRIIDFDQVTLSSLNRHAVATLADVATPKVMCMRRRLEQITPWVRFDCRNELFRIEAAEKLLGPWDHELLKGEEKGKIKPAFIIDCIDNIDSKVALLEYCHKHSLRVVSSMGAGCKSDPTRVCIGDISASIEDPLSRSTRRRLKILGVNSGIPVVFSTEKPGPGKAELLPLSDEEFAKGNVGDLGVLPDFRVRILPVLGTMPAVFGYTAANHVICQIAGYPLEYRAGEKGREKMYDGMLSALQGVEERLVRNIGGLEASVGLRLPLSRDDVQYLVEEVFRGKSVISRLASRLALVRWRRPNKGFKLDPTWEKEGQKFVKLGVGDLVLMTKDEAQRHEREVLKGDKSPNALYESAVIELVAKRQKEEEAYEKFR